MKILLAGPGTGKTTKIKSIIAQDYANAEKIKVLSFTNATVNDLTESFNNHGNVSCSTLHGFALGLNHLPELHILIKPEEDIILSLSTKVDIEFSAVCEIIKCITFNAMISQCVSFVAANPAYAKDKIGNLDLLLVDEFQDFNPDEQKLVLLTSALAGETIILGDDDQSIYGFKDADPDGIIKLYKDGTIEKIPHENICYRCPDTIVDFCVKLLSKNKNRIEKEWNKSNKAGDLIIHQFMSQDENDNHIIKRIKEIKAADAEASILILSPVGFAVETLKTKFAAQEIAINDCWSEGYDKNVLCKIWILNAVFCSNKLAFIIFILKHYSHFSKARLIRTIKQRLENDFDENTLIREIIDLGYLPQPFADYITNPPTIDDFFLAHPDFEFAKEFVENEDIEGSISKLVSKVNPKKEFKKGEINLMSIHKSKGLQADYVFISGLVSGILPNETKGLDTIEAQRRLLFVGLTRALKELTLTSTVEWDGKHVNKVDKSQFEYKFWTKKWRGKTSKFIQEIAG
ncbi:MAG: helicase [Chitinophagaceae bacterium]|nr:helicase [Chitinophagaceae bacterium]